MSPANLTCQQVLDFLMEYLDGELSSAVARRFEAHLGRCPACTDYLDSYKKAVALGKMALPQPEEPLADVPDELVEAILASARSTRDF